MPFGIQQEKEGLEKILEESKGNWIYIIAPFGRFYAKYIGNENYHYKFKALNLVDMPEGARYVEEEIYIPNGEQLIVVEGDYEKINNLKENPTPYSRYKGKQVEILLKNNKLKGKVTKVNINYIELDNKHLVTTEKIEAILEK